MLSRDSLFCGHKMGRERRSPDPQTPTSLSQAPSLTAHKPIGRFVLPRPFEPLIKSSGRFYNMRTCEFGAESGTLSELGHLTIFQNTVTSDQPRDLSTFTPKIVKYHRKGG